MGDINFSKRFLIIEKRSKVLNAGEEAEKREPSYTADGNVN